MSSNKKPEESDIKNSAHDVENNSINNSGYRDIFDNFPIPVWELDFSKIKMRFDSLRNSGVTDFRAYFNEHPDEASLCSSLVTITGINIESRAFFSVNSKEEIIESLHNYFSDKSVAGISREDIIAVAEGKTVFENEISVNIYPGKHKHVRRRIYMAPEYCDTMSRVLVFFSDITDCKNAEKERGAILSLFEIINEKSNLHEFIESVINFLREWSGMEAIGIRLKKGDDYPYFVTKGFPDTFVKKENHLCVRNLENQLLTDEIGNPVLECMCGNIISGRYDPSKPFFTRHGSFWSNCTTNLLATTSDADRQARTRNRCNGEGYESVALIPLRTGGTTFGLIQLNDRRENCFTAEMIELLERIGDSLASALAERKAKEALIINEKHYHSLFENMQEGFAYCKMLFENDVPQDFIYLEVNEVFEKIVGIKNVIGKKVSEVIPGIRQADPELFNIYGRVSLSGKPEKFDLYLESLKIWFSVSVYSPEREYFVAVFDNITKRKMADAALKESETRYRRLFETAKDGILILDADSGQIVDVNPFLTKLLKYSYDEFLGKTLWEISPFKNTFASHKAFTELQSNKYIRYENLPLETRDGQCVEVEFVSNVYMVNNKKVIQCNIRDITDRKRAEEKAHKMSSALEQIFKNMINAFIIFESVFDENGKYVSFRFGSFNDAYSRISGLKMEDVLGKDVFEVWPETEQSWVEVYGNVAVTGIANTFDMYHGPTKGWYRCNAYRPADSPLHVCVIFEDITLKKKAEEELISIAKFPDENPNPVIRIANGAIIYKNKASAEVIAAWGGSLPEDVRIKVSDVLHSGLCKETDLICGESIFSV